MHDVGVALDVHQICHFDGSIFADTADVVAAEVDEHDVLGAFLFVGEHLALGGEVGGFAGAARAGSGDGAVLDAAAFDADQELGRGADDVGGFFFCLTLSRRAFCRSGGNTYTVTD